MVVDDLHTFEPCRERVLEGNREKWRADHTKACPMQTVGYPIFLAIWRWLHASSGNMFHFNILTGLSCSATTMENVRYAQNCERFEYLPKVDVYMMLLRCADLYEIEYLMTF